ncbi:MAG: site-specific integrase [Candidatus Brocadiaceae bacterium]|nr:site-specific integrase [Candidatus Brocadiaceae bacterium]
MLKGSDRIAILIGLFCGLRLNETLRLQWSNFDFDKGILHVYQSKTNKTVLIPLARFLIDELVLYKSECVGEDLFEGPDIKRGRIATYCNRFRKLFKRLGIHGVSYHTLRHSFATICSDVGSDIITTKELLNHSDITMTMRYTHKQMDVKRNTIDKVAQHILNSNKKSLSLVSVQ